MIGVYEEVKVPKYFIRMKNYDGGVSVFVSDGEGNKVEGANLFDISDTGISRCWSIRTEVAHSLGIPLDEHGRIKIDE